METSKGFGWFLAVVALVLVGVISFPFLLLILLLGGTTTDAHAECVPGGGGKGSVQAPVQGQPDSKPPAPGEKGPDGRPAPYYGVIPVDYDDKGETSGVGGLIPQEYEQDVIDASKVSGIPTSWLAAQIEAESRWNAGLGPNEANASGLTQFTAETWATYGHGASQSDGHASIRAMGEYLRDLKKQLEPTIQSSGQDWKDVVMAGYNAGPGGPMQYGGIPPYEETQTYVKRIHVLHDHFYKRVYGDEVGGKSDGSVDNTPVKESSGEQKTDGDKKKDCGGNYSGGSTSGNDDYPWKGYAEGPNPITGAYYVNCTDFSLWRLNQQVGATDPQKPKYTNSNFVNGRVLGNGGDWADTWRAKGWPVDNTPEVGAMAHFYAGAPGASATYGHIAVVKEVKDDGKTVVIEEYNATTPHAYGTRQLPASNISNYLHIPDSEKKK